jgi:site-specific recombinase XerD
MTNGAAVLFMRAAYQNMAIYFGDTPLGRSKAESSGPVFTTESGTAVDPRSALRAISTAAKAFGMSGVGMHTLRHSFATHMLAAGVPLHTV